MNPAYNPYKRQQNSISRYSVVWSGLLFLIFAGLLGRVVQLKLFPPFPLNKAAGSAFSSTNEMARRGDLLDREGRIIATSSVGYRLFVDPQIVEDLQTIAADIANLIGGDPIEYDKKIIKRQHTRYVAINHLLNDQQIEAVRRADIRGVGLEPRLVRKYASDSIGNLLIGMVGFDHTGLAGMEQRYNQRMLPEDGRFSVLKDSDGQPLWIVPEGYTPRYDGENVRLSLDLVIQEIAERHLRKSVERYNAGGGRLVVADPQTGEILAMCDILNPRAGWDEYTTDPNRDIHPSLGRNRCATDPYEPGSTFKPFIWSVATELGRAELDEILPTPSNPAYVTSKGRRIRDSHYYGPSSWEKVLIKSMNSGMAHVAERLTHKEMQDAIARWGFGKKTGCRLPGESSGIVTPPKRWNHYSQTSVSYGQEISVTALQMVQAFSAFTRDGTLPDLRLTAVADHQPRVPVLRRVITKETVDITKGVLRKVMTEGSGRKAQSDLYQIFAKSGTAQLPKKDGGGYHENRYVSSFIGAAPFDNPRVIVLCIIDDPDKSISHWGGIVAGPVVRDVIDETLAYLGVAPDIDLAEAASTFASIQ